MGGWKLEVFRMGCYLAFPVTLFYAFNQPYFHERYLMKMRKTIFPPENPDIDLLLKYQKERMQESQKVWEEEMKKQAELWEKEDKNSS